MTSDGGAPSDVPGFYKPTPAVMAKIRGVLADGERLGYASASWSGGKRRGHFWVVTSRRMGYVEIKALRGPSTYMFFPHSDIGDVHMATGGEMSKYAVPFFDLPSGRRSLIHSLEKLVAADSEGAVMAMRLLASGS